MRTLAYTKFDGRSITAWMIERMLTKYHFPNTTGMNVFLDDWECDVLTISKSGYSHEYEVKLTAADFRNDAMKTRRRVVYMDDRSSPNVITELKHDVIPAGHRTNRFSYVMPETMLGKVEIPDWAGLVLAKIVDRPHSRRDNEIWIKLDEERKAPMIHKDITRADRYRKTVLESLWYRTTAGLQLPNWHVPNSEEFEGSGI